MRGLSSRAPVGQAGATWSTRRQCVWIDPKRTSVSRGRRSVRRAPVCQEGAAPPTDLINRGIDLVMRAPFGPQEHHVSRGHHSIRREPVRLGAAQPIKPQATKKKWFGHEGVIQSARRRCQSVGRAPLIPQGIIVFQRASLCQMGATRQSIRRRRSTQLSHLLHQLKGTDFFIRVPLCREGANLSGECSSIPKALVAIVSGGYRSVRGAPVRQECITQPTKPSTKKEVILSWRSHYVDSAPNGQEGAVFNKAPVVIVSGGHRSFHRPSVCPGAAQPTKLQLTKNVFVHEGAVQSVRCQSVRRAPFGPKSTSLCRGRWSVRRVPVCQEGAAQPIEQSPRGKFGLGAHCATVHVFLIVNQENIFNKTNKLVWKKNQMRKLPGRSRALPPWL